jgi:ketohexokinase
LRATPERVARVLGVGIATLDLILDVAGYPPEDAEVRALAQRRSRGGNAANTLAVLRQLGHACTWVGTLADDPAGELVACDLARRGIDTRNAVRIPGTATPTSYIALSRATGSRTIVHYRDLPELAAEHFARVPLDGLDWVHFEGRNPPETARMLARLRREAPGLGISVELEKPRAGIDALLADAGVLLVARAFALAVGGVGAAADPAAYLAGLAARTGAHLLVLGWGAEGAWILPRGREAQRIPPHVPARVVDTLGAGDVLNAGVIDGLVRGLAPEQAVESAVRLAGIKCARMGLDGLGGPSADLP